MLKHACADALCTLIHRQCTCMHTHGQPIGAHSTCWRTCTHTGTCVCGPHVRTSTCAHTRAHMQHILTMSCSCTRNTLAHRQRHACTQTRTQNLVHTSCPSLHTLVPLHPLAFPEPGSAPGRPWVRIQSGSHGTWSRVGGQGAVRGPVGRWRAPLPGCGHLPGAPGRSDSCRQGPGRPPSRSPHSGARDSYPGDLTGASRLPPSGSTLLPSCSPLARVGVLRLGPRVPWTQPPQALDSAPCVTG